MGVGLGYVGEAELTEQRFVENPFALGKMYKTGDKARWLSDGNLEFIGRNDHQVNMRGYRIELGEIESQLKRIQSVNEAALRLDKQSHSGGEKLVAYITSEIQRKQVELWPPSGDYLLFDLSLIHI